MIELICLGERNFRALFTGETPSDKSHQDCESKLDFMHRKDSLSTGQSASVQLELV
jgi:hypothetical protein